MKRKDKILLLILTFFLVVALIVVLGIVPTRDKIKSAKKEKETFLVDNTKLETDVKSAKEQYKQKKKELDEIIKENNFLDKRKEALIKDGSKEIYKKMSVDEALSMLNNITLKYNLPIVVTKDRNFEGDGIGSLLISLPDGNSVSPEGYFMGYTLKIPEMGTQSYEVYKKLIKNTNKANGIEEYIDETKMYWANNENNFNPIKTVGKNRIGGVDYILRKLTKEIESNKQLRIKLITVGRIVQETNSNSSTGTPTPGGGSSPQPGVAQDKYYVTNDYNNNTDKVELIPQYVKGFKIQVELISLR